MEVGKFGLGKRNDRGERVVEFCKRNKLMITNTWFEQEKRRRYTWKKPGDTGRYQIDYIMVKQRYRNSLKSSWSYPGADVDSDHNLVAMRVQVRLKRIKKAWKTSEMIKKIEKRRKWKSTNTQNGKKKYRQLNNELRRETEKAKEKWWEKECKELEELDSRGRSDLGYAKVNKLSTKSKSSGRGTAIRDDTGKLLTEPEQIRKRWKEYIELLYDKDGKPMPEDMGIESEDNVHEDCKGPNLLESEIMAAVKEMKKDKAVGEDNINAEFWKVLGEKGTKELVELCKEMYVQGVWPEDFTKVIMIPLQKKANAVECGDHRTISLISHASKILLKVRTRRIEAKTRDFIGRIQFGFRRGCGTRDAIGVMRVLCERSMEFGNDVYICFVDFEKAFDRVNWVKMMEVLKSLNVDWRDRRMISQLYMKQEAVIRIADGDSEPGIIGRGVRQGCPLSPLLFLIYAEMMMVEALVGVEEGIRVGGELISDVRFADDQGMIASSESELQRLMDRLYVSANKFDMKINVKKTKSMVVSRKGEGTVSITVDGKRVEQVKRFKYLGSLISEDGRCIEEVKQRIGMAK